MYREREIERERCIHMRTYIYIYYNGDNDINRCCITPHDIA